MSPGLPLSGTAIEAEYRALTAALGSGQVVPADFDPARHPAGAIVEAQRFWRIQMVAEHRSAPVFLLLAAQLLEADATLDEAAIMLRMAQDELRHAELCGLMLQALGEAPVLPAAPPVTPLASHAGTHPRERALRNVLYTTCLSEMVACARLVDALELTSDPVARSATRAVLADEVMHGQFGFLYLDRRQAELAADPQLRASLETYLRHAFAVLEHELAGPALAAAPRPSDAARALGVVDPVRAREVFYGTLTEAVVPGLEQRGLGAGAAWRTRQRLA